MTGTDIIRLAESFVDDAIEITDAILWINECLLSLGIEARVYADTSLSAADAKAWYPLPTDFVAVSEIEDGGGGVYEGMYWVRDGKIKISLPDTYNIHYHKLPDKINTPAEVLQAHSMLEPAMALFVASRFKSKDDDENTDAIRLMKQYEDAKKDALRQIDSYRQDGSMKIEVVYGV